MQKTPATEALRREKLEKEIEDKLALYPYLICEGLPRPKRQEWINTKDRVDLLFVDGSSVLVVEIKCEPCGVNPVKQITRYVRYLSQSYAQVRGLLIGPSLTARGQNELKLSSYNIKFVELDVDVPSPSKIVICRDCRRAYASRQAFCPHPNCGSQAVII